MKTFLSLIYQIIYFFMLKKKVQIAYIKNHWMSNFIFFLFLILKIDIWDGES